MGGSQKPRLIVGLSGSSGLPYGIRLLEVLRKLGTEEVHLILTDAAKLNISVETDWRVKDVEALADVVHNVMNISRSEEHTSELQSLTNLVCRLLLEKKKQ